MQQKMMEANQKLTAAKTTANWKPKKQTLNSSQPFDMGGDEDKFKDRSPERIVSVRPEINQKAAITPTINTKKGLLPVGMKADRKLYEKAGSQQLSNFNSNKTIERSSDLYKPVLQKTPSRAKYLVPQTSTTVELRNAQDVSLW